jgi:hypothetical protein
VAGDLQDMRAILETIPGERFRFLSADRRRAYAAILWRLLEHRRAHEIEIPYDDLMVECLPAVADVEPGSYDPELFRTDVRQLEEWGNLAPRRLEPRRIETLADRRLQKFLCRLDDETAAILEFLEGRARMAVSALSGHGSHFLRDAEERLSEALRLAVRISRAEKTPGKAGEAAAAPSEEDILRFAYLCVEADRKVDEAARELSAFDAALVTFAASPFRLETLADVVDRLDRYVEDYVSQAAERAGKLHRAARKLLRPLLSRTLARAKDAVERRLREDPFAGPVPAAPRDPVAVAQGLVPFFAPGGRFDGLLERVHGAARDVVRRVHAHIAAVRARNIRIETLRDRSRQMARIEESELPAANAWIDALFASAHLVTDLRPGTPEARSAPPRPVRRYRSERPAFRGEFLTGKTGRPGQWKALQRARLLALGRFVEERILRESTKAPLSEADLSGLEDFRFLLSAVKAHDLRGGRDRRFLSYRVERSRSNGGNEERARLETAEGALDAPDLLFSRRGGGAG